MSKIVINASNYKTFFSWEKFQTLIPEERKELLKFTVEKIRQEKGLKEVDLQFKRMSAGSRGSCTQKYGVFNQFKGHEMTLNDDILTTRSQTAPYSTYNTINHELEHAVQYERSSNRSIGNDDAATLEQRLNDEHYYSSSGDRIIHRDGKQYRTIRFDDETDFQLYRAQACESDARAAGLKAVDDLRESNIQSGVQDEYIDNYLEYTRANEISNNRDMLNKLGMHSRENMVREELNHISIKRVSEDDRKKVIEYARQKDFETAKEVLRADACEDLSEEQLKQQFDNDGSYQDFYKTERYNALKVQDAERKDYKYSSYKWEDGNEHSEQIAEQRNQFRRMSNSAGESPPIAAQRAQFRSKMGESINESDGVGQREKFSKAMNGESVVPVADQPMAKGADNSIHRN